MTLRPSLAQRFVPTRHPSWREFAKQIGGRFHKRPFWRSDEVVSRADGWEIHLDTVMLDPRTGSDRAGTFYSTRRGTRAWASYSSIDGLRFAIQDRPWARQHPFRFEWDIDPARLADAVRERLGVKDVEIGNAQFDERYTVRANQPDKLRALLDADVLEALLERPALTVLRISGADPGEPPSALPATLIAWERRFLDDPAELAALHGLCLKLMNGLARIGSAAPAADVELPTASSAPTP